MLSDNYNINNDTLKFEIFKPLKSPKPQNNILNCVKTIDVDSFDVELIKRLLKNEFYRTNFKNDSIKRSFKN